MRRFEKHLCSIGQQVTVRDSDRQIYTSAFDIIRDSLLRYMKKNNSVFKKLYKGPSLFGSYSNNVRINCPNEFDVHITLSPPYSRDIIVEEDEDRPGFVHLDFSDVIDSLFCDDNLDDVYEFLYDATDRFNYLIRGKIQKWLEDLFEDAVDYYENRINGYYLQYSKRGLAHTIFATNNSFNPAREISIDFVPAFIFGAEDWMRIPTNPQFQQKCDRWYAIPKPTHGIKKNRRISFMICNPKAEHHLLLNKQNLKTVFRLLKSLRKAYGLQRLKSYFITTAFLFEIEKQKENFWLNSVDYLFVHPLVTTITYEMNKLEQYLQEIVASIVLDKQRQKDLIEDFNLIREYLLEILKNTNPDFKDILIKPSTAGIKKTSVGNYFDVLIVFDLSKYLNIQSKFDKRRPGFLNIEKRGCTSISSRAQQKSFTNLFVDSIGFLSRSNMASTVRDYIELGLIEYGCYIRGHKDEIYVLELNHYVKEDAIVLNAFSENQKLSIEFKIIITGEKTIVKKVKPMPRNNVKTVWFAALECIEHPGGPITSWQDRVFSISTPHIDFKVAQNICLCMTYRLLRHLLPDLKEFFIRSALFEEILYLQIKKDEATSKLLLSNVLIMVLLRLERYFRNFRFPFYFNTNINMLANANHFTAKGICSKLQSVLRALELMRNDQDIEFEAVEQFFDVRVDVNLIKVDSFGAFNSF